MHPSWLLEVALAATGTVGTPAVPSVGTGLNLAELVTNIYNFAVLAGGLLAFGVILYGAVKYTVQAGNPSALEDAKEWILQAFLGLLLLLGAWLVLNTINPEIVKIDLPTLKGIKPAQVTGLTYGCLSTDGLYACARNASDTQCSTVQGRCATGCEAMTVSQCGTRGSIRGCVAGDGKYACQNSQSGPICEGAGSGACQGRPCSLIPSDLCGQAANSLCADNEACPAEQACIDGACRSCSSGSQCRSGQACLNESCQPIRSQSCDGASCNSGYACSGDNPPLGLIAKTCYISCQNDNNCPSGLRCKPSGSIKTCF
jgi:hypothetical protein